jgi:hypothetical protein
VYQNNIQFIYGFLLQGKDAVVIFSCFILILLFGFSTASWALLITPEQVTWSNTTNNSFFNVTEAGQDGSLGDWQLLRDVLNWGIWKVFGQVAEPFNDKVSGTNKVAFVVTVNISQIYTHCFRI